MWNDVVDLREFYRTPLGLIARRMIRRRLREMWPDLRGLRLAGLGFAVPFLRPFLGEAERVLALMPARQGVLHWPPEGPNLTALVDEETLALPDLAIDRVVMVHALEHSEPVRHALRAVWRIMAGNGRLIIVAPNRRGLWARTERTPFGHGVPYSAGQLARLLRESQFVPLSVRPALFMPPFPSRLLRRSASWIERVGARWFERFAGVIIIEATKQIYVPSGVRLTPRVAQAKPAAGLTIGSGVTNLKLKDEVE